MKLYRGLDEALGALAGEERERALVYLRTPDLYPANKVAGALGVRTSEVWKWRRDRGIKKADS